MSAQDAARSGSRWWHDKGKREAVGTAVPVVGVNSVAFAGQFGWLRAHLPWPVAFVVLTAITLETIAIYLAYQAHKAQLSNDSSLRLRLGSYAAGAAIGALNYSHYAGPGWYPTAPAVIVGGMSVLSPILWAIHSRRTSRDKLMESGLIEEHALRLGGTRWAWHPLRSLRVQSRAAWSGETSPARAIGALADRYGDLAPTARESRAIADVPPEPDPARAAVPSAPERAVPAVPVPAIAAAEPPAIHRATARLAASPQVSPRISYEVLEQVARSLSALPDAQAQALTQREVARMICEITGGTEAGARRAAKKVRDARIAEAGQALPRPAALRAVPSDLIRPSAQNQPGGVVANG